MLIQLIKDFLNRPRVGDIFCAGNNIHDLQFRRLEIARSEFGYVFTGDGKCSSQDKIKDLVRLLRDWDYCAYFHRGKWIVLRGEGVPDYIPNQMRVVKD